MSLSQYSAVRSDTDDRSDTELLAAHVSGDRDAFSVLIRRHQAHLWLTAVRTSYTRADAEDALQEALLSVHRTAANFRADAAVRSWLHTIVVNACLDRIRRNKVRSTVPLTEEGTEPPVRRDEIAGFETSLMIDRALFTLPPEQRAAVVAVDVEGYSVADAAKLLGVPPGTIKSRCARAREKLAERLEYLRDPRNRQ
ncbi:RNA polymerase sigma factor SigM [Skermania piniformis]|uniref:RNA polymerase sigma factor SigM n=1 Tax=Skermania pinensis TaxID=39122 RepID=A0ABX8S7T7_9ACTN|nr:RNA polymerase sigma factor SigM [Skermania piniformis]QXQ13898.1 RNA polymerase sigma factor SigM [Skermania piniformis]